MRYFLAAACILLASISKGPTNCPLLSPAPPAVQNAVSGKHFDHVLIVVLENQGYTAAKQNDDLRKLADEWVDFTNFRAVGHPSYPNYLAMVSGSTFGISGDSQKDFSDDIQHKTIADLLDWRNYAEDYPAKPGEPPYLRSTFRDKTHNYARKHVPFLSFQKIQKQGFQNVVSVAPGDAKNSFRTDIENSRRDPKDPQYKPLARYMLYTPNMDDDGHDTDLATASKWLKRFLDTWFPPETRKGTLTVITFDEGEPPEAKTNHIYTVCLGDMVKKGQQITQRYDHYSMLLTIEDNFGFKEQPRNSEDAKAEVITDIWN